MLNAYKIYSISKGFPMEGAESGRALSEAERELVIRTWNASTVDYPRDKCIHEVFAAQVQRAPDAIAVVWDGEELTYLEVDRRANRLARHLRMLGVDAEVPVCVCLERSAQMVVAWIAILKAGGAYVHLDPDYPAERLAFMMADSGASVLITVQRLVDVAPGSGIKIVQLDRDATTIAAQDATAPPDRVGRVGPDSLAYIVYTSGSTGKPKGIATSHTALVRLVVNTDYIPYEPRDSVAQVSNASFDLIKPELWGALLNGARLVGIHKSILLSPTELARELRRYQISVLILPTALFNQVARTVPAAFSSVKHLLFGGEAVDPQWVAAVLAAGPPQRLIHVYGPAENSCLSTWYQVTHVPEGAVTVPIGRGIANTQVYVLDPQRQPVPVGVAGELYIAGPGLARGYVGRPELTAERFVPDPVSGQANARLYRTGDQVRWLPDGNLEFIGRFDFQVKLRGFRIELGEIETVLAQHPSVALAVAIIREDRPGDRRLVVYAVLVSGAAGEPMELRRFLQGRLPDYMMPSAIVILDALPLNPNGKVDRKALPAPRLDRNATDYVAPRAPLEDTLAGVWAEVLGVERVGVHDNFFELGGHSLLAIRLFARLEEVLGHPTRISLLFQAPTVARLAEALQRGAGSSAAPEIIPLRASGTRPPLFCVPGVLGMGFIFADLARYLGADQPVYAFQSRGFSGEPLHTCIEDIAAYYIDCMRAVKPAGPYRICGYSMGGSVAWEMARQLSQAGQDLAFLGMIDAPRRALPPGHIVDAVEWDSTAAGMGIRIDGRTLERLVRLGIDQLSPAEVEQVLTSGLGPPGMTLAELRPMVPVLGGNFHAFWRYRAAPQPVRIAFFRACEPFPPRGPVADTDAGWGALTAVDVRLVSGRHSTVVREPHVHILADHMRQALDALDASRAHH